LGHRTANLLQGDVLIDGGRVAEVGQGIRARDAEVVDAADTIVMPGFVDAHRHAWRSLFRNAGIASGGPDPTALGPGDFYAATLIGLLGALEAGITTVVDWAELPSDEASAEAALQAHADAGLRTVLVLAGAGGEGRPLAETAARLAGSGTANTTLAYGSPDLVPDRLTGAATGSAAARALGLRIHAHAGTHRDAAGAVAGAAGRGLLGEDVTLAHCTALNEADVDAIASSRASIALTPASEMAGGLGPPPLQQLIDRGVRPGLGVGDERIAPGDLFAQMRSAISIQHATLFERKLAGKAGLPRLMSTRDVIRHATVDGAKVAGLSGVTGSLEPGLQADLVVLRTDRPNIFPVNDPIGAVVWGMDTSNVDWVFVGGRPLVRRGVLEADVGRARSLAAGAHERVAASTGLPVGAAGGPG
jgi:cytosine/adenosine deaminase-related metal-dependent hydrolase